MSLKIRQKQSDWLKENAPGEASDFLDEALNNLHKFSKGRISKAVDMNENEFDGQGISLNTGEEAVVASNDDAKNLAMVADMLGDGIVKSETDVAEEVVAEVVEEVTAQIDETTDVVKEDEVKIVDSNIEVTTDVETPNFADVLKGTIIGALKEYTDTVITPLMQAVEELKNENIELRQKLNETSVTKSKDAETVSSAMLAYINSDLLTPSAIAAVVKENFATETFSGKAVSNEKLEEVVVEEVKVVKGTQKKAWYDGL